MTRLRTWAMAVGALTAVSAAAKAEDNVGLGHLDVRSLSPGHLLRPNVTLMGTEPLEAGAWSVRAGGALGNLWLHNEGAYTIDGEWIALDVRVSRALTESLRLSVALPVLGRTGGFTDGAIEGFHEAFGLGNAGREGHPRNQLLMDMDGDGDGRHVDSESWGFGDVPVYASWRTTPLGERGPTVLFGGGASLPTGDETNLEGLGVPLWGASVLAFQRIGRSAWTLYGGGSVSYADVEEVFGIRLHQTEASGLLGLQVRIGADTAVLAQYLHTSPVARDYHSFSDSTHELHVGIKRRVGRGTVIELALLENVVRFNNSMDVGAALSVVHSFGPGRFPP